MVLCRRERADEQVRGAFYRHGRLSTGQIVDLSENFKTVSLPALSQSTDAVREAYN